jgi:hypothetical protein
MENWVSYAVVGGFVLQVLAQIIAVPKYYNNRFQEIWDKLAAMETARNKDREERVKEREEMFQAISKRNHDTRQELQVKFADIDRQFDAFVVTYLRRDEFLQHTARMENGQDQINSGVTALNRRIDGLYDLVSKRQ